MYVWSFYYVSSPSLRVGGIYVNVIEVKKIKTVHGGGVKYSFGQVG